MQPNPYESKDTKHTERRLSPSVMAIVLAAQIVFGIVQLAVLIVQYWICVWIVNQ